MRRRSTQAQPLGAKRFLCLAFSLLMAIAISAGVAAAVPNDMNFQGRLLDDMGDPVSGPVNIEVGVFLTFAGGLPTYTEDHLGVTLRDGVFSIIVGMGSNQAGTLDATTFAGPSAYLEVSINGETLVPRQIFNSTAYSLQSDVAGDADTVDGLDAADLDQSGHVADIGNPHLVTASQTGAATQSDIDGSVSAHAASSSVHHAKTSLFGELAGVASDGQIPSSITRDTELSSGLSTKADFSHFHNAANINSGTLSTARFDAYSDLSAAGRLNNNSSTDLLTRGQADTRYGTISRTLNATCPAAVSYGTTFTKIGNVGSFTKTQASSVIQATFHGRLRVATMTGAGAKFEMRIDDSAASVGRARAIVKDSEVSSDGIHASMSGIFNGLSSGAHTVSIWVEATSGTGTGAMWDVGCFSSDHVIVNEYL